MISQKSHKIKPAILVILDGFGLPKANPALKNAIFEAKTPHFDNFFTKYPHSIIHTSGIEVGLPENQMGNSEVGHLNIGAGRIIDSNIMRISESLNSENFSKNLIFQKQMKSLKKNKSNLHLMGLLSDGGVHSHIDHLKKIIICCKKQYPEVMIYLHVFLDGRDTSPTSGSNFVQKIQDFIGKLYKISLSSIIGRYYAMDRDKRWERIQKAYQLLINADGILSNKPTQTIENFYNKNITDEFMEPIVCDPSGCFANDDGVLFFNFRADRARQLSQALIEPNFSKFKQKKIDLYFTCLTEYDETFKLPILFPSIKFKNILGEVIAKNKLRQLRLAETEKYAHVTFFLNGGEEKAFENEERVLIPSPKVATYDLAPEMSALLIKDELIQRIKSKKYELIIVNFANGDMLGHTGNLSATIKAIETLDLCMGEIENAIISNNLQMLITADHGNCEQMLSKDKKTSFTQHTTAPVPLIYVSKKIVKKIFLKDGKLADIAPTLLYLMDIKIPHEMTGEVLITIN